MKTKILLLPLIAACLLISQSCCHYVYNNAGEKEKKCPAEGFDFWAHLTKAAIHGSASWNDPVGFQVGGDLPIYFISFPLSVRGGAMISLQGANWREGNLTGRTDLFYAYVPIVLRYQHSSGFYGEAGLQPGFLLSAKDKYESTTEN